MTIREMLHAFNALSIPGHGLDRAEPTRSTFCVFGSRGQMLARTSQPCGCEPDDASRGFGCFGMFCLIRPAQRKQHSTAALGKLRGDRVRRLWAGQRPYGTAHLSYNYMSFAL
jgi:hypothetical protein